MWLRHLFAIAVLPFTAAILIPVLIARRNATPLAAGPTPGAVLIQLGGLVLLATSGNLVMGVTHDVRDAIVVLTG